MKQKLIFYISIVLSIVFLLEFSLQAQDQKLTARIVPINGQPFIVQDLKNCNMSYCNSNWRGSSVKLLFSDIVSISFLKPGDTQYLAEVVFKDGRKDNFNLSLCSFSGTSTFGSWDMNPSQIKQIFFGGEGSAVQQNYGETSMYDQIIMKNGDLLSGRILTTEFVLRTSYGTNTFQTNQIKTINFEGGGQNIDLVLLKIGDKLSGVIDNTIVKMQMRSGSQVELSKDKIKDIVFKK
jgi:hypothetical protein